MEIRLYYTPHTRSLRPRWLLEELEIPYQLELIDLFNNGPSAAYKQINPLGAVPAISIDGHIMLESGAICHWLADHFSDPGLAPPMDAHERLAYEQWMFFAPGTLEPPAFYSLLHSRILPETERVAAIVPWAMKSHQSVIRVLDKALQDRQYLLGDAFSAADIMVGSTLMWLPDALEDFPALQTYTQRLKQRPAYQRAIAE